MLRLALLLSFLFLSLNACKGGYDSCKLKTIHSNSITNQSVQLPIAKAKRLVFSQTKPHAKILKHDKFLSLYLIEDKKAFKYPYRINKFLTLGLAVVDNKMAIEGKIKTKQIGLNKFATFSEIVTAPSLLLNSCCALEGIVTPRGIIQKEYIERFLKIKKVSYSDIGIRVKDERRKVIIDAINPFMKENKFKVDDEIILFDKKRVKDASSLMMKILFSKVGTLHTVKIKREGVYLRFKAKSKQRVGGGFVSDTFLEHLGIHFDAHLNIIKIEKKSQKYGLRIGDRLIQVNKNLVKNQKELMKYFSNVEDFATLLFERENFQFFVNVN